MRWLLAVLLSISFFGSAAAQVPSTQCVTTALAGGTPDAITTSRLPCVPTTTLLILRLSGTNTTTTPTLQPVGSPAQTVMRANGSPVQPGDLAANAYVMLTNNGRDWLLLTGGGGGTGGQGPQGPAGQAATVTVGTTTTGAPGTPAAVTNSGTSSAAVLNFTIPQGLPGTSGGTGGGGAAWQVVTPSGSDDTQNINTALTNSANGVILTGGTFQTCSTIVIPRNKGLVGTGVGKYASGTGGYNPIPWPGSASIWCPTGNTNSFDPSFPYRPAAAILFMHDNSFIRDFAITGDGGQSTSGIACVSATNTQGIHIDNMVIANCGSGLRYYGDGDTANPGDQGTIAQAAHIQRNTFWWTTTMIDMGNANGGSGCADFRVQDNEFETPYSAAILMNGCIIFQVQNNRIEDGYNGIYLANTAQALVQGNLFNNLNGSPITLAASGGTYGMIVTGNTMQDSATASSTACIALSGPLSGSTFANNQCLYGYQFMYSSDQAPGGIQDVVIADLPLHALSGSPAFFADATTTAALTPWALLLKQGGQWVP